MTTETVLEHPDKTKEEKKIIHTAESVYEKMKDNSVVLVSNACLAARYLKPGADIIHDFNNKLFVLENSLPVLERRIKDRTQTLGDLRENTDERGEEAISGIIDSLAWFLNKTELKI
ncbi:MAG: hypothetical protein PHU56_03555 [Candidatus Pacebacteria bacterium]|nr:hypothetical protein [Candidatus Paceibacterota bacterium]